MGHEDSDFFAFGAETELPLVNIAVSTVSFFIVAPALLAALCVYLHIYLHSLWDVLAKFPPRIGNDSLEERVYPTMLCTLALAIRRRLRRETGGGADRPGQGWRRLGLYRQGRRRRIGDVTRLDHRVRHPESHPASRPIRPDRRS